MSCFWDALIRELTPEEKATANLPLGPDPIPFAEALQKAGASCVVLTTWQSLPLKETERRENAKAVREFNPAGVANGYLCGACDAFLLLVCQVTGVNIRYTNGTQCFEYVSIRPGARWVGLRSSRGHMH